MSRCLNVEAKLHVLFARTCSRVTDRGGPAATNNVLPGPRLGDVIGHPVKMVRCQFFMTTPVMSAITCLIWVYSSKE